MKLLSNLLDMVPYIGMLRRKLRTLRAQEGYYPAGHYYSPIPNKEDVNRQINHYTNQISTFPELCPGIDLHSKDQFNLLKEYKQFYNELPYTEVNNPKFRYHFRQDWFCYADAIFLYCHLRKTKPRKIVEVGSGYSSALILDTTEYFLSPKPEIFLIEPNPERLYQLMRLNDKQQVTVIEDEVQNVPISIFSSLESGDLLFIDSSHVVKAGSDLNFLFFDVIPQLSPGVIVHFHDIFFPFDYISDWLLKGRYWNESYFLRAFLSYNSEWKIRFFNSFVGMKYQGFIAKNMPLSLKNTGGSIYIEKVGKSR